MIVMTSSTSGSMADFPTARPDEVLDNASDYGDFGSDAEEVQILNGLLASIQSERDEERVPQLVVTDIEDYEPPRGVLLPKNLLETCSHSSQARSEDSEVLRGLETANTDTKRSPPPEADPVQRTPEPEPEPEAPAQPDTRSPLERFRRAPKKALSVTDLVSPAWCELQYFYVLTKHGRKRRTPAMRQGSAIHKTLEEEIHITVPVETTTKEDSWGLRIWNICQGLKTLRDTGRTRELEIWGTVGGELVNGIIDELSFDCPDPNHEESLKIKDKKLPELPEYQTSITEYLMAKPKAGQPKSLQREKRNEWVYITDVKTRATATLPTGSSLRPTIAQLHLYHHMLENLVQGHFNLAVLTERYQLDSEQPFSDSFIAQLGNLNQATESEPSHLSAETELLSSQDSVDILLQHNNMRSLWQYMMSLFRQVFLPSDQQQTLPMTEMSASQQSTSDLPPPPSQPTRLSPLLTASYLLARSRNAARMDEATADRVLGHKSFQFDPAFLHAYLSEVLPWWRGERDPKGVALQEAWKCRSCDFKRECAWIQERDKQALNEALQRRKMRAMADVESPEISESAPARSHV